MSFKIKRISIVEDSNEHSVMLPLNHFIVILPIPEMISKDLTSLRNPSFKLILQKIIEGDEMNIDIFNKKGDDSLELDNREGKCENVGVEYLIRTKLPCGVSINNAFSNLQYVLQLLQEKGHVGMFSLSQNVPVDPSDTYHLHGTDSYFPELMDEVKGVYFQQRKIHGDSYLTAGIDHMRNKLREEIKEWEMTTRNEGNHPDYLETRELCDIMNVCLMLMDLVIKDINMPSPSRVSLKKFLKEHGV